MVAIEKRFEIYQKAYSLLDQLVFKIHIEDGNLEKSKLIQDCYEWWRDHCLYLAEPLRSKFRSAIHSVEFYNSLKGFGDDKLEAARQKVYEVYKLIEDGLGLPHMDRKADKSRGVLP